MGAAADVFISYAREDAAVAEQLARALEERGWVVWWDRDLIAGDEFDRVIEEQLHAARAVIVVWSDAALGSRWVRSEASDAADRGVVVPVILGDVTAPLQYRTIQSVRLHERTGGVEQSAIDELDAAVRSLVGQPGAPRVPVPASASSLAGAAARPGASRSTGRPRWPFIVGGAAVVAVVVAVGVAVLSAGGGDTSAADTTEVEVTDSADVTDAAGVTDAGSTEATSPADSCVADSETPAVLTFVNNEATPVDVYYLDDSCAETRYATIVPGGHVRQETFLGDVWQVRDPDDGSVLTEVRATADPSLVAVPTDEACSTTNDQAASMTVTNDSAAAVDLYWVREDCTERYYTTVQPGESVVQPTYHSSVWSARSADDASQLDVHTVTADDDTFEIS